MAPFILFCQVTSSDASQFFNISIYLYILFYILDSPHISYSPLTIVQINSDAGTPAPLVTWTMDDGELLDEVSESTSKEQTTNNLTISGLARQHLLRVLTCRASNSNLTAPLEASVTIDMTRELGVVGQ